jgi:hypothetical protein
MCPFSFSQKLLMDVYESIEPIQLNQMEAVFEELQKDEKVQVAGTHIASLINAYGCVAKNFGKAISIGQTPGVPPTPSLKPPSTFS